MSGFFDRFRSGDKIEQRKAADALKEAEAEAAREELKKQKQLAAKAEWRRQAKREVNSKWTYQEITDEMRGTTMSMANLVSENSIEFPFPYHGGCKGMIAIRKRGNQFESLFTVTNGQLDIGINGYSIATKVDSGRVEIRTGEQPAQGSTNLMFLSNPLDFIRSFQRSDRLMIEACFYQHGPAQFTFDVAGLEKRFCV